MQIPTPNPDVFETQCWACHIMNHPQELLAEAFDHATPGRLRKYIQWTLQAAGEPRICTKEEPGQLMVAWQVINSVILAAAALLQDYEAEQPPHTNDPHRSKLRLLSRKDRADPYRVFRRFFKYQSATLWKQDLNRTLGYALSRAAVDDTMNLLPVYWHLTCLVEAAWVVQVRAKAVAQPVAALQSA